MRVLIIDDDPDLCAVLKLGFERECFAVDTCFDGERGSYLARTNAYDLIILDHMLPRLLGADVCKQIRAATIDTPILMLTLKTDSRLKVTTLNDGADDFVTKPFSFEELVARARALLRRPRKHDDPILVFDTLRLDPARHHVSRGDRDIDLTRKEFALLEYLLRNSQCVLSRGMILEHVWDSTGDLFSNTIEVHIGTLRRKIELPGERSIIQTIAGRGYKIDYPQTSEMRTIRTQNLKEEIS